MKTEEEYRAKVLQLMRDLYPTLKGEEKERAERLFPELKESEDEKIRNRIIERLKCMEVGSPTEIGEEVSWLTKQGEQNLANSAKTCKNEQGTAWSEEDEEIHRKCICAMRASACGFPEEEKFVEQVDNWFKFLKERVQPKVELTQLDKNILEAADCYKDMITPEEVDDSEHAYSYETYTEYQIADAFKAGAKWQEKQMQSAIELAEDHAMLAGMEKMREKMMKDAVGGTIVFAHFGDDNKECGFVSHDYFCLESRGLKNGDKVKVIILKDE